MSAIWNRPVSRRAALGGIGAVLVAAACSGGDDKGASGSSTSTTSRSTRPPARTGPWSGTLATTPDANGLLLPAGFTSRVVATSGQPVAGTDYVFPPFPDGAATFADPEEDGGWYYAVNAEAPASIGGGVSSIRFAPDGEVVDAYRLVGDTSTNCAGGATPWDTWLTCEEVEAGRVFECDPFRANSGEDRPALGRFVHEAVCVDAADKTLYLTEDRPDGLFYRFTPDRWPNLGAGTLEAAVVAPDGTVTWREVPDPTAEATPIRAQGFGATPFNGGEGVACGDTPDGRRVWFATKGDNVIRELDPQAQTMTEIYRATDGSTLRGVDNLWWDENGQRLFVAEDGDNLELVALDREGTTAPMLQLTGHEGSEIAGPALDPSGETLLFVSQRGRTNTAAGIVFAVTGPFAET
jgi:secreted PhoX family phosphatase